MRRDLPIAALLLLAASCLAATPAQAQDPLPWEHVPLHGGEVAALAFAPSDPSVLYAAFEVNAHALYASEDGGATWEDASAGLPENANVPGVGVDPTGHVVYAGVEDEGLYVARLADVPPNDAPTQLA